MNSQELYAFLLGGTVVATFVAGLFFLKFWRATKEVLFLFFALAFWVLCLNWTLLVAAHPTDETRHYYYVLRLVAFGLIIAGVVHKNRRTG